MKKKLLATLCCMAMVATSLVGCGAKSTTTDTAATEAAGATGDVKVALITMDSIDQHWITLNEGADRKSTRLNSSH